MPIFPIASSKSLGDARIACVFFLALEKIFGANCKGYLRTVPKSSATALQEIAAKGEKLKTVGENISNVSKKFLPVTASI